MKFSVIPFSAFLVGATTIVLHQITLKILFKYNGDGAVWFHNAADDLVIVLVVGVGLVLLSGVLFFSEIILHALKKSKRIHLLI